MPSSTRSASSRTTTSSASALANLAAGFSSTFVVNGSPTKTEMVDEAKSHTQVAQLTTAVVVAIVLLFLTKPLQYLPNAVLSAVVFLIGLKLIDIANMREIWRLRRDEFWVAALTATVVVVRRRRAGDHPRDRAVARSCTCGVTTARTTASSPGTRAAT